MNSCDIQIDGVSKSNNQNYGYRINSPLEGRFVDNDSLVSLVVGTIPLGVHTLRFWCDNTGGNAGDFGGIELNAHGKFTDATCDTNHTTGLGSPVSTSKITMDSTAQVVAGMSVTGTGNCCSRICCTLYRRPTAYESLDSNSWCKNGHPQRWQGKWN